MLHNMAITRYLIRTVDTDVVVLAVMVAQRLLAEDEVWLAFGTERVSDTWQPTK